jgi:hypothetical protein
MKDLTTPTGVCAGSINSTPLGYHRLMPICENPLIWMNPLTGVKLNRIKLFVELLVNFRNYIIGFSDFDTNKHY